MGLFSKKIHHHGAGQVDMSRLPRHIAIIMDGNGRWAKQRGLPRTAGHKVGAETFRKIATYCKDLGVEYLTVYAFSTENWKRPADEVGVIMGLLKQYMLEAIDSMERDQIRLRFLGDLSAISPELQALVDRTNEISSHIHGFQANVCLNYGAGTRFSTPPAASRRTAPGARPSRRTLPRRTFPPISTPPGFRTRSSSSAPAARSACPAFCCGSAPIRSFTSAIPCGRTSTAGPWTKPSSPTRAATGGSAA